MNKVMSHVCKRKSAWLTFVISMVMVGTPAFADSGVGVISDANQAVAAAQVNFRIRVPDKVSLSVSMTEINAVSNAGNLYVLENQQSVDRFISSDRIIELQQSVDHLSEGYTLAVL